MTLANSHSGGPTSSPSRQHEPLKFLSQEFWVDSPNSLKDYEEAAKLVELGP